MPLYEYHCEKCGKDFEVRHGYDDPPVSKHEKCEGKVTRKISPPALVFKGSGWTEKNY